MTCSTSFQWSIWWSYVVLCCLVSVGSRLVGCAKTIPHNHWTSFDAYHSIFFYFESTRAAALWAALGQIKGYHRLNRYYRQWSYGEVCHFSKSSHLCSRRLFSYLSPFYQRVRVQPEALDCLSYGSTEKIATFLDRHAARMRPHRLRSSERTVKIV